MASSIRPAAVRKPEVETPKVTLAEVQKINNNELAQKERKRIDVANEYKAEKRVKVTGSPMYRAFFGNAMPISLNGVYINVPLDGRTYDIPESFAIVFHTRIRDVDDQLTIQKRLSNVTANHEQYAGELDLVRLV